MIKSIEEKECRRLELINKLDTLGHLAADERYELAILEVERLTKDEDARSEYE